MDEADAALGCVLGAFVGDAAGAVLEFRSNVTLKQVESALAMPGGGVHQVGPGQVTDDSEMAMCLLRALTEVPPSLADAAPRPTGAPASDGGFPAAMVVRRYVDWVQSNPFDMGVTTANALEPGASAAFKGATADVVLATVTSSSLRDNLGSKANGALMRATPLAVWARRLPTAVVAEASRRDAALTHPNQTTQDANAAYVIAAAHLCSHPGDGSGAIAAADDWAATSACDEVQAWLRESQETGAWPDCSRLIGFARWGFVHAFRHLRERTLYRDALTAVLLSGGDTDTNAAIVGGLVGALHGASAIPADMREAVLGRRVDTPCGRPRPVWLLPLHVPPLVHSLLQKGNQAPAA